MDSYYQPRSGQSKKKDNHLFSKFWVSILILSIFVYVTAVFYFYWHGKYLPDAIHYTFLPAIFVQLTNMMLIARKNKDVEINYVTFDGRSFRGT